MSSVIVTNKTKLAPLNLTSETVYQILKQAPRMIQTNQKIFPTVKYTTEQIRSTTQIKNNIFKKIRQLQRINSQNKRTRIKTNVCRTQVSQYDKLKIKQKQTVDVRSAQKMYKVISNQQELMSVKLENNKKFHLLEKRSADKYYERVSKIKNLKLKQYMKNKFAIDIKTIQTARQQNTSELQEKLSPHKPSKSSPQPKKQTTALLSNLVQNNIDLKPSNSQNIQDMQNQIIDEQNVTKKYELRKEADIQIKYEKVAKKVQRIQKSQTAQKVFSFTREFQDHPADKRFQRMNTQLNTFLLSFGVINSKMPKQLPNYTRYCFRYKYYIGSGNNKNLIVSLMKKRWWWTEANSMNQANFIWTQIKQSKVFQNCNKYTQQRPTPKFLKIQQKLQLSTKNLRNKDQQQIKCKLFHKKSTIKQNFQYKQKHDKQLKQLTKKKLHNHYQGNCMLGNKKALFFFISRFCQYKNLDRYNYIPQTFHILNSQGLQLKNLQDCMDASPNSYWLIKPGQNSNRGNGISVTKSFNQIKQKIKNLTNNTLIIQKYIDNLFLYKNRKFDIRTYMLAITIGGSTKFYWHSDGYLRTSSYQFNLQDPSNIFIHLTNDAIQSTNQKYSKYQKGNKLSYQQFQRYLDKNYRNKNYEIKSAHEQMRNIAKLAVEATYPQINSSKLQNSFQIFGLDFILDSNFKPWLIEVNTNPCLQLSAPCLQTIIPQMLQNAFRIALDPIFQPCVQFPRTMSSCVPDNIFTTNKFQLIFDDFFDRDVEWQNKIKQAKFGISKDEEDQQVYEGDGQILDNI